jgi:putative transposase
LPPRGGTSSGARTCYLDDLHESLLDERNVYVITVMENYSRAILWSAVTRRQNLDAFLLVLYRAVERYGAPEALVTDSGSIFLANRAQRIYEALGIDKKEIEKGAPWQNYSETTFNIQRRMADRHFNRAENWAELLEEHERWWGSYNAQRHSAHERRTDGRRSPEEVLQPFLTQAGLFGLRHPPPLQALRRGSTRR